MGYGFPIPVLKDGLTGWSVPRRRAVSIAVRSLGYVYCFSSKKIRIIFYNLFSFYVSVYRAHTVNM